MKARLSKRKALFYSGSYTKENDLRAVLSALNIDFVIVAAKDLHRSIVSLLGYHTANKTPLESGHDGMVGISESCLVVYGLGDAVLDRLLAELRRKNARPDLIAVVTQHNQNWSFSDLVQELRMEQKKMSDYTK